MENIKENINTPTSWTEDERNMANTYLNIANVLPIIQNWMKSHVNNLKDGGGVVTIGDIEEALKVLEEQINNRLRNSVNNKVVISLTSN